MCIRDRSSSCGAKLTPISAVLEPHTDWVLALDEATSHLDIANEHRVTQALTQLPLTRIIVAHWPETIAGAQRVVRLQQGQVQEVVRGAAGLHAPV